MVVHHKTRKGINFAFVPVVSTKPGRKLGIYKHCRTNTCAMMSGATSKGTGICIIIL